MSTVLHIKRKIIATVDLILRKRAFLSISCPPLNLTTDVQISSVCDYASLYQRGAIADAPFKPDGIEHAIMSVYVDRFDCRPFVMEISLHSGNNGQGLGRGHRVRACNSYSYWLCSALSWITFDFDYMLEYAYALYVIIRWQRCN